MDDEAFKEHVLAVRQKLAGQAEKLTEEIWQQKLKMIHYVTDSNEDETLPHMHDVLDLLYLLNNSETWLGDVFPEEKQLKFFTDEYFLEIALKCLLNLKYRMVETLNVSNKIIEECLMLALRVLDSDNPKFVELVWKVLEPERRYYQENNQIEEDFNIAQQWANPEHKQWIYSLKPGDVVDAVKKDNSLKNRVMCWSRATVVNVDPGQLSLKFMAETEKTRFATFLTNSVEVQPRGRKIPDQEWEWRMNLKVGDVVDCIDSVMVWYRSTVMERHELPLEGEPGVTVPVVKIGFREYLEHPRENHEPRDSKGKAYQGWSEQYDIDMPITSARIRVPGSMSKALYKKASTATGEDLIDDSNDEIYYNEEREIFAIPRFFTKAATSNYYQKKINYTNIFFVQMVNRFGNAGGFDKIIQRIENQENWLPFDLLSMYLQALGNITPYLTRRFCLKWIPKLKEAVWNNLLKTPLSNLRNFNKKEFTKIKESASTLLKRVYSIGQKNDMIDQLVLDVAWMCFNSQVLDKRVWGLKEITEVLKDAKNAQPGAKVDINFLKQWVQDKKLFQLLYTQQDADSRLIERSGDFLKFFIEEALLEQEDLEQIWRGTKNGNSDAKLAIYKCLQQASIRFNNEHLNFLVEKITGINCAEIRVEELELFHDLLKSNHRYGRNFQTQSQQFFWSLICSSSEVNPEIVENAVNKFSEFVKSREAKIQVLGDCCANIEKDEAVVSSIQVIERIIRDIYIDHDLLEVTSFLLENKSLEKIIMENLKRFKEIIKNKFKQLGADPLQISPKSEALLDEIVDAKKFRLSYRDHIQTRIGIVHFIFSKQGAWTLNLELLIELWNEIIENGLSLAEKDIIYKWFSEVAGGANNISILEEDLRSFFHKHMCQLESMHNMTESGLQCFRLVFCIINQNEKRLTMKSENASSALKQDEGEVFPRYMGMGANNFNNYQVNITNINEQVLKKYNSEEEPEKKKPIQWDGDFIVLQDPNDFKGIKELWEIVFFNQNSQVIGMALEFLNKIYTNLSEDLEEKVQDLKHQYLKKAYGFLEKVIKNNEGDDKILRALNILQSMIDESEKQGNGGLKSLTSLVAGEVLQLNFINESFVGHKVPRLFQLKVPNNVTVYELLYLVGQQVRKTYDCVGLVLLSQNRSLQERDKGKTLCELKVRNQERFQVLKVEGEEVQKAQLIDKLGKINPRAEKIFRWLFTKYSRDEKMSKEQCAMFIRETTNGECSVDDQRVKNVFLTYDTDKDDFMTEENFLQFYFEACRDRPQVVWENIKAHHYRLDLLRFDEVQLKHVDARTLPRYILSRDQEFFRTIFSLLDKKGEVSFEAWELLSRLPISPDVYGRIVILEKVRSCSKPNWENILDSTSDYKLLYSLFIIEYLMEDNRDSQQEYLLENDEFYQFKRVWKNDFIICGGFDHIWSIFQTYFKQGSILERDILQKKIFSLLIKIIRYYSVAVLSIKYSELFKCINVMAITDISTSLISSYYNEFGWEDVDQYAESEYQSQSDQQQGDQQQANQQLAENQQQQQQQQNSDQKDPTAQWKDQLKNIKESLEFLQLKNCVNGGLGVQILSKFTNFEEFLTESFQMMFQILNSKNNESEDRLILQNLVLITSLILINNKESRDKFFSHSFGDWHNFFLEGLFTSKSQNIRSLFSHSFFILCVEAKRNSDMSPINNLMKALINNMPGESEEGNLKEHCTQYFDILCSLIDQSAEKSEQGGENQFVVDFHQLMNKTMKAVINHKSSEARIHTINDKVLIGLLNLSNRLLLIRPELRDLATKENFVMEIFGKCLFDLKEMDSLVDVDIVEYDKDWNKCKGEDSRNAAYQLLFAICKNNPSNMAQLVNNGLIPLLRKLPQNQGSSSQYRSVFFTHDYRSPYGYAGIKNLGCICYMNAMLQQLFMTPTFRYAVMVANDGEAPNEVQWKGKTVDDNVFHQLQKMFGYLEFTDRQDYNPEEFCFSYKDWDGIPIKVGEQQDSHEFLNGFFDKIENALKRTPFKHILHSVYGGETSTYVRCKKCSNVRERKEPFLNLTVEVQGSDNLMESLQRFITGEDIDDYNCEACKQKVGIVKGTYIQSLPNVLIVRLQRIVFDLDSLQQMKVNSYLSFPMNFSIEPFTKEGVEWREKSNYLANTENPDPEVLKHYEEIKNPFELHSDEYYEYKLVGVVVHVGSADFGHYYSYIDTHRDKHLFYNPDAEEKWLEYNDSRISPFTTDELEVEAFGGCTDYYAGNMSSVGQIGPQQEGTSWGWGGRGRDSTKNAYLLVYERRIKQPLRLIFETPEEVDALLTSKGIKYDVVKKQAPVAVTAEQPQQQTEGEKKPEVKQADDDQVNNVQQQQQAGEIIPEDTTVEVLIDYFTDFSKQIPPSLVRKVWEDNQTYMMERNVSASEFFHFIKEITNVIELPELTPENCPNGFYKDFDKLSDEVRQIYKQTIDILQRMIVDLLHRNVSEKFINEMIVRLKQLLKVSPDYCLNFFDKFIVQQQQKAFKNLLENYDRQTRTFISNMMSESINIAINYSDLHFNADVIDQALSDKVAELDDAKYGVEKQIIPFLKQILSLFEEQVPKNWQYFSQYFLFWKNFAQGGEWQIKLLFHLQSIQKFLDFMLDRRSPLLGVSVKSQYRMGSQYSCPDFDNLIDTVAVLAVRADTLYNQKNNSDKKYLFQLTNNEKKLIYCAEFWHMCLANETHSSHGYSHKSVAQLIQIFAYENLVFTEVVAWAILRGNTKLAFQESKPYFRAVICLLSIEDSFTRQRCELLLGVPQLNSREHGGVQNFGTFGITNIEDYTYTYSTTIQVSNTILTSFLDLILGFIKRKLENLVVIGLRQLFLLANSNSQVFRYLIELPSPTYQFANFIEFLRPFVKSLIEGANNSDLHHYLIDRREQVKQFEAIFNAFLETYSKEETEIKKNYNFLIGQTVHQKIVSRRVYEVPENQYPSENIKNLHVDENSNPQLEVAEGYATTFVLRSQPDGVTNLSLPQEYLKEATRNGGLAIDQSEIKADSPWCAFFLTPNIFDPLQKQYLLYTEKGREFKGQHVDADAESKQSNESEEFLEKIKEISEGLKELSKKSEKPFETKEVVRFFRLRNYSSYELQVRFTTNGTRANSYLPTNTIVASIKSHSEAMLWIDSKLREDESWDKVEWTVEFDTFFKREKLSFNGGWPEWTNAKATEFDKDVFSPTAYDVVRNCNKIIKEEQEQQ